MYHQYTNPYIVCKWCRRIISGGTGRCGHQENTCGQCCRLQKH
jgi:hypothetical protein